MGVTAEKPWLSFCLPNVDDAVEKQWAIFFSDQYECCCSKTVGNFVSDQSVFLLYSGFFFSDLCRCCCSYTEGNLFLINVCEET